MEDAKQIYVNVVFPIPSSIAFTYRASADCKVGMRVVVQLGRKERIGIVVAVVTKPSMQDIKDVISYIDKIPLFSDAYLVLAQKIASFYFASLGECLFAMIPTAQVKREKMPVRQAVSTDGWHSLSAEQEQALAILQRGVNPYVYIYGITGSGKTEVFLRAAQQVLERGNGVIYMVPEIALSYQLIADIRKRFSYASAILHSGISNSERLAYWRAIASGEIKLVVGTRSAVFAPVVNLKLIVIDEEHDNSYKSSQTPRYHARQVAMMRCKQEACTLLMGSATPSVEAWYWMRAGNIECVHLKKRVAGGSIPEISLINMAHETSMLSVALVEQIENTVRKGMQALLFLNRRGFSHIFFCRSCGETMICSQCAVYMTYHKSINKMLCHYCGYSCTPRTVCEHCSSLDVGYASFGTQKLEEELKQYFPNYSIARLDSDSARKKGYAEQVLQDARDNKYNVLVGTQMIAKGFNIPNVKLVGIILADTALSIPDFRASERTFSQIVQVSGRASRFSQGGKVLVQALRCEHNAIRYAVSLQIEEFYRSEIEVREQTAFPPFTRLVRFVCRSVSRDKAEHSSKRLGEYARKCFPPDIRIVGPAECYIHKVAGKHRFHLVFSSKNTTVLYKNIRSILDNRDKIRIDASVHLEVDVDPLFIA